MSYRFFSAVFLIVLASPYLGFVALENTFLVQPLEEVPVTYEPHISYWDETLPEQIEVATWIGGGTYLFTHTRLFSYGKSGLFISCSFDDKFYNMKKVRLNITFTDPESGSKYFRNIRVGVGDNEEVFRNLSARAKDRTLVYDYGTTLTWDFSIRDYIHLKNDFRVGERLCFILEMFDNGDVISYFNVTDTVTFDIDVFTVDFNTYFGAYEWFVRVVIVAVVVCDLYMVRWFLRGGSK